MFKYLNIIIGGINMKLLKLIKKDKDVRCYSYCIGLKYDRILKEALGRWVKSDINTITQIVMEDLKKLKIPARIVDKNFKPFRGEKLIALRFATLYDDGDYYHDIDYHMVIKKLDGYWYSKFHGAPVKRLEPNVDLSQWNWRDGKKIICKNHYDSEIAYIAVKC
jgi:hypothetical protein